jgi:hypothetical protein
VRHFVASKKKILEFRHCTQILISN